MLNIEQRLSCVYCGCGEAINSANGYERVLLTFIDSINCEMHHYFIYQESKKSWPTTVLQYCFLSFRICISFLMRALFHTSVNTDFYHRSFIWMHKKGNRSGISW